VKRRAYRLDMSLCNFCGIRFGWSSIIALLPVLGDALDAFMALMVVHTCEQVEGGLPGSIRARMMFNVILDFGIGLVPFIGDVADAIFRANTRNAAVLEEYLREKGKKNLRQSGLPIPAVDPSDPAEFDRLRGEDPPIYTTEVPAGHGAMSTATQTQNRNRDGNGTGSRLPSEPAAARIGDSNRSGGGFFGFGSKSRPHDVEMGAVNAQSRGALQKQQPGRSR
jgi:Domain of unknown function (DUF4112)